MNAFTLACAIAGRLANFVSRKLIVDSVGRPYSHDIRPSANMFLARSASRGVTPSTSPSAPTVIEVSCTGCTCQPSSEPSSSGFDS